MAAEARLVLAARTVGPSPWPATSSSGTWWPADSVLTRPSPPGGSSTPAESSTRWWGPAGTGKTHVTRAITGAWKEQGGTVVGLALSQNTADVLGGAAGIPTQNIAKWLIAPVQATAAGPLVIVDEAGMVPTAQLDQVVFLKGRDGPGTAGSCSIVPHGPFCNRRPTPPKMPTVAWINKPTITNDAQKES